MPPVTQFVFGQRWAMPLIVVLLTLGCAGLFWISHQLSRRARNLVPRGPGLGLSLVACAACGVAVRTGTPRRTDGRRAVIAE